MSSDAPPPAYGVIALIRFSFLADGVEAFRRTRGLSAESRRRAILDPGRLERRFRIFEAVCLPALAAQPKGRFAALILAAEALPERYAARLRALTAPHPNIRPVFAPPMPPEAAFADALAGVTPQADVRITVRLDDDDALSADFTDRLERYRVADYLGHCLTPYLGYGICRVYGRVRLWRQDRYMGSAGLGLIGRGGERRTIYDCGPHGTVGDRYPTLADGRFPATLQTSHRWNDAGSRLPAGLRLRPWRMMRLAEARAELGDRFPVLHDSDFGFL